MTNLQIIITSAAFALIIIAFFCHIGKKQEKPAKKYGDFLDSEGWPVSGSPKWVWDEKNKREESRAEKQAKAASSGPRHNPSISIHRWGVYGGVYRSHDPMMSEKQQEDFNKSMKDGFSRYRGA